MKSRLEWGKLVPDAYKAPAGLERYLQGSGLEKRLMHLVKLRASQVNHCAYCIDMHWKDLRAEGETEQRLYGLNAWGRVRITRIGSGQRLNGRRRLRF